MRAIQRNRQMNHTLRYWQSRDVDVEAAALVGIEKVNIFDDVSFPFKLFFSN